MLFFTADQIAVTPTLINTSDKARRRFTPAERGCYFELELPLKFLNGTFYRYEMSNCLVRFLCRLL